MHIVAPTFSDARDTCIEGNSGLLSCLPETSVRDWNRSIGEVILANGTRYKLFSAETPQRLRGPQCNRAWCDELGAWGEMQETWDMLMMGLRLGSNPQCIVTTTPRPMPLIRELVADHSTFVTKGSTYDNRSNLAPEFFDTLRKYEGTRLGRQELHAEILEDVAGALWTREMIDSYRVPTAPGEFARISVGVDPAVTSGEGSDETGIAVLGLGGNGHAYLLADESMRGTPQEWARRVVDVYHRWNADRVIGEVNNGGDLIEAMLRGVDASISYRSVRATRGKYKRAEPVAALAERGMIHHVGAFPALEDQLCMLTPDGQYDKSPDRADAFVWAVTDLAIDSTPMLFPDFAETLHVTPAADVPARLVRYMAVAPRPAGTHAMLWLGVDLWGDLWAYREICEDGVFSAKNEAEAVAVLEDGSLLWQGAAQIEEGAELVPGETIEVRLLAECPGYEERQRRWARYGINLTPWQDVPAAVADDVIREALQPRHVEGRGTWPRLHVSSECPRLASELAQLRRDPGKSDEQPAMVACLRTLLSFPLRSTL